MSDTSSRIVLVALFSCSLLACSAAPDEGDGADAGTAGDAGSDSDADAGETQAEGAATGAACTADADCAGTSAKCLTTDATGLVYPGGSCSASCRVDRNDSIDGVNRDDCPGSATCLEVNGRAGCFAWCSAGDCRDGYVCVATSTEAPACLPRALTCDSERPREGCDEGEACFPGSGPDDYGVCLAACDPTAGACDEGSACYPVAYDGSGQCRSAGTLAVGQMCTYAHECVAGAICVLGDRGFPLCAAVCGGSAAVACPEGRTCTPFSEGASTAVAGFCK